MKISARLTSSGRAVSSIDVWIEIGIVKLTSAFLFGVTVKAPAARNTCQVQGNISRFSHFTSKTAYRIGIRGTAVDIATGYALDTQRVPGAFSPWVKRPGSESDHSLLTSTKVKKTWIYTSAFP
jgi:hypothetical protein